MKAQHAILKNYKAHLDIKALAETTVSARQALRFLLSREQRIILKNQRERNPDLNLSSDEAYSDENLKDEDLGKMLASADVENEVTRKMLIGILYRENESLPDSNLIRQKT